MFTPVKDIDERTPWWSSPGGISLGFLLPMFLLIASVEEGGFEGLTIRTAKFLTAPYVLLGAALIIVMAIGGWLGTNLNVIQSRFAQPTTLAYERTALFIAAIALAAYIFFFRDFLLHPAILVKTLIGAYRPDRSNVPATVGITSFVNVAPVFFSIHGYLRLVRKTPVSPPLTIAFFALLGLTLLRVYAWSERLALIEAIVPIAIAAAVGSKNFSAPIIRRLIRMGPYAALVPLVTYFGLAEFFRSWGSATYHQKIAFWRFVLGRITTYYYTSLNNGAGVLATTDWPTYKFESILTWLHRLPVFGRAFSSLVDLRYFQMARFLTAFGDAEFNNPSGLFGVVYDVGVPGGIAYFAVVGFLGALLLQAYRVGRQIGVLLYPMFFLFFMEVFRYPYFGSTRAFTWLLGIFLALISLRINSRQETAPNLDARSAA